MRKRWASAMFLVGFLGRKAQDAPEVFVGRQPAMSRCSLFLSAPTVRFLRTVEGLRRIPEPERRKLAADLYSQIKPLVGTNDCMALKSAARAAQDSRWRLISAGAAPTDFRLAAVKLVEEWFKAQAEVLKAKTPVAEILAAKRADVVEQFIRDNLSFESGDVIFLRDHVVPEHDEPGLTHQTAAA